MRIGLDPLYRRDKAVAAPGNRLDTAALRVFLIERAARGRNLDVEVVVPDGRPRPGGGYNLVPGEEFARPLEPARRARRAHARRFRPASQRHFHRAGTDRAGRDGTHRTEKCCSWRALPCRRLPRSLNFITF